MQEVAQKILVIRQMYDRGIKTQKQSFKLELEKVKGKVKQLKSKIKALKTIKQFLASKLLLAQKNLVDKTVLWSTSNG